MEDNNKVQIIVHCRNYEERREILERMGYIKYKLPMIDAYVIEIREA